MPEPRIILPHGGYRKLIVYRKSDTIYQGTVVFCRRFLPEFGDRTVDQMTRLEGAGTVEELEARAAEVRRSLASAVASIKRRKGWDQ